MDRRSGLTFADILIIIAIVLLFVALAIPLFRRSHNETADEVAGRSVTNRVAAATNTPPARVAP